jgi:acetoin utilization protein AcuC
VSALFAGSEIYRGSTYGGKHPLAIPRVSTVIDLARALGWLPADRWRTSPRAKPEALAAFHTPAYVAALMAAEAAQAVDPEARARHGLGTVANPVFPEMFRRPATGAGGALMAAELVRAGGVVHVPGAGTHHALADRAAGFCYLNDPVLCLMHLKRLGLRRIAYVDIDAHHMDGVEAALAGDPAFLLISTHEEGRWPFTGRLEEDGGGNAVNLPLPRGLNDSEFAAVRDGVILPFLDAFGPEAIVAQCGSDALEEDPLSRLALSNRAYLDHLAALRGMTPRLIVTGGGGYNPWSVARCWTALWGLVSDRVLPEVLPREAAEVLEALVWPGRAAGRNPPAAWTTTLIDPPRPGPVRPEVVARIVALRMRLPGLPAALDRLALAQV